MFTLLSVLQPLLLSVRTMAKALTLEQAGKVFLYLLFSVAALFFGPHFANRFIFDPHAPSGIRGLGVAIAILSVVPMLGYAAWGFGVADEYNRQTMLIGTSLAFALAILFSMT